MLPGSGNRTPPLRDARTDALADVMWAQAENSLQHRPLRARDLYEQGDLVGAALREADACDNDGYYITAKILRELVERVGEVYRG